MLQVSQLNALLQPLALWLSISALGLGVLFSKLQQGVQENRQVLTVARMRAEAEEIYSQRLGDIAPNADKVQGGFSKDDGASVRKVRITSPPRAFPRLMLTLITGLRWCSDGDGRGRQKPQEDCSEHSGLGR